MGFLRVHLFGDIRVTYDKSVPLVNMTHATQSLLAYLMLQRNRYHSRDSLGEIFWSDFNPRKSRSSLSTTLWRLRSVLESMGIPKGNCIVIGSNGDVGFDIESNYWLDVEDFETHTNNTLAQAVNSMDECHAAQLEKCLQLYRGELLEGFYDDWVIRERVRLHDIYVNGLARMMQYYRERNLFEQSIEYGKRVLDIDPLREEIHRAIMRMHLSNGERTFALRQYEMCRDILGDELGIPPMLETQALYAQIAMTSENMDLPSSVGVEPENVHMIAHNLRSIIQSLDDVSKRLLNIVNTVEDAPKNRYDR